MDSQLALHGGKPVRDTFLIFGSPRIEQDEIDEVVDSLKSGWLSTGPKVNLFQEAFKQYIGCPYACAVNSGTAALHLSLKTIGVQAGDEVITTPLTFAATANVIIHTGAIPVFVDIKRETLNIDEDAIEQAITPKTKAIIPVHMAGRPCHMDKILAIARKHKIRVIEDAAHAIGAEYHNKKIGTLGDLTCFSFYVTKNITTGEGGMVTTYNKEWSEKMEILGLQGMSRGAWMRYSDKGFKHYQVVMAGYKYNMMDIQAALGLRQLEKIERYLKIRENIWERYDHAFKDLPLMLPPCAEAQTRHARHLYTLLLDLSRLRTTRDAVQQALHKENIGTGIHFISLHLHPFYKKRFGFKQGDYPHAEFISDRTLSLPLSAKLTDRDVEDVIQAVRKVVTYYTI